MRAISIPLTGQEQPIASFEDEDFPGFRPASQTDSLYAIRLSQPMSPYSPARSASPPRKEMAERKPGGSLCSKVASIDMSQPSVDSSNNGDESLHESSERFEDSQYSVIEPLRPASHASAASDQAPRDSAYSFAAPVKVEQHPGGALGALDLASADQVLGRPASRASSLSSGVTIISRPATPTSKAASLTERMQGKSPGSSGSASGWEDLGEVSSDEEGSLVSRLADESRRAREAHL